MKTTDFLVSRTGLSSCRFVHGEFSGLDDGQVLLKVEKFALTANNISYALMGEQMGYWNFFPAPEGEGRPPVWGFGKVLESRHPGIKPGERIYGYFPMSSHLVITPSQVTAAKITDGAAHRVGMSPFYNDYSRLAADPLHREGREDARMLYGPLFTTAHLIERTFADAAWHGADALIVTSASSKTAMALALLTGMRNEVVQVVGVTSQRNRAFVEGLGIYDRVITYDGLDQLPISPSVLVDFAGDASLLGDLLGRLGKDCRKAYIVGATHWTKVGGAASLAEPPELFFAPTVAASRVEALGAAAFGQEVSTAWTEFLDESADWLDVAHLNGEAAVQDSWQKVLAGNAAPSQGLILGL